MRFCDETRRYHDLDARMPGHQGTGCLYGLVLPQRYASMGKDLRKEFNMAGFVAFKGRMIISSLRRVYVVTREENFDFIKKAARSRQRVWKKPGLLRRRN